MGDFILYNKNFHRNEDPFFTSSQLHNLLFCDQMRMLKSQLPFWDDHLKLWKLHFQLLRIKEPLFLTNDGKELKRQIERALVKNKCFKGATIRLSFFVRAEIPEYQIEISPEQESAYIQNPDGYQLELFQQIQKSDSQLSALQIGSEAIWKIAEANVSTKGNVPIIMNLNHCLLETPGANLFIIKNRQVYSPAPVSGCYINPAKRIISQVCEKSGLPFNELEELYEEDLMDADEVFIANDLLGIQHIRAFGMKRFYKSYCQRLAEEFNRLLIH